jgi:hypothetical protein
MLLAMVVAVRQALDYRAPRKRSRCLLGGILAAAIALVLGIFLGPTVS